MERPRPSLPPTPAAPRSEPRHSPGRAYSRSPRLRALRAPSHGRLCGVRTRRRWRRGPRRWPATSPAQYRAARLLLQPHGFESLRLAVEGSVANHLAIAEGPQLAGSALDLPVAPLRAPPHAGEDQDVIAHLDELLGFLPEPVPRLEPVTGRLLDT